MLLHEYYRNKTVGTPYGAVKFNQEGISKDLTTEQEKALAVLPLYSYKPNQAPKKASSTTSTTKAPAKRKRATKKTEPKED